MFRFHLPRDWSAYWPVSALRGLHIPDPVAHPSERTLDEVAAVAAIVAVGLILIVAF